MGKSPTIAAGVTQARDIVQHGGAREKLEALVRAVGDGDKLNYWKSKAGV